MNWVIVVVVFVVIYQGRSINNLQNGVFWLIFKISKIPNIRFMGNLFLYLHKFFITMTSLL